MTLSKMLREELKEATEGTYSPAYFRYMGFRRNMSAPITPLRAAGIHNLFSAPNPHIFKNDLIVGNTRCLYVDEKPEVLSHAASFVSQIGSRSFWTNSDHYAPNYVHTLEVGVPGLIREIDASLAKYRDDAEKVETLSAMKLTLEGFSLMIKNYADTALSLMDAEGYDNERLRFIADNCTALTEREPRSFAEGLQLVWLCHTAFMMEGRYAMALGRFDQYLYPLYKADRESGRLSFDEALTLIENTFTKIPSSDVVNICIGGTSPTGECDVNELSYATLLAVKNGNTPGTNLSARITHHTPDDFLRECLLSIGTGLGYPALMNDSVNIPALEAYGYAHEDACNYCMVGCIENFITGMQPPWSDSRFDPPRYLDYVFNRGISKFGNSFGIDQGDINDISSMDEFMKRYEEQLALGADEHCLRFNSHNSINQEQFKEPFLSCFCHDCIGRGMDINCGGAVYPSVHGACIMGVGTVADSLAAIEKVVFVDRDATLSEIRDAINANFEGFDELRQKLLAAPKYGNDDDFADKYAVWFLDYLHSCFTRHHTRDGGGFYIAMAANTQNISAGKVIGATPDGRLAGAPLSDAASPTYGRDMNGPTSTLISVSKPDYRKCACGTVINQKYSPSMFEGEKLEKLLALVKSYFEMGGQELQINATSRKVLIDAMEHPENYENLVVRVSGFSAYFNNVGYDVQVDILNRTQHE